MENSFDMARELQAEGHFVQAAELYRAHLALEPDSFKALNNLGVVLKKLDQFDDAIESFAAAAMCAPTELTPRFNLADTLYEQNRFNEARDELRTVLELAPDHADAHLKLAISLSRVGDLADAESEFRQLLGRTDDIGAAAASGLGRLCYESQRYPDALNFQLQAVSLMDTAEYRFHLALGCRAMGMHDKAVEELTLSIALDPGVPRVHEQRIRALLANDSEKNNIELAFKAWEEALPDDPTLLHMRGAWHGDEDVERASTDYVRETFSGFAQTFDSILAQLDYQAWQLVADHAQSRLGGNKQCARVLDMGCGTGLSGVPLRDIADVLIGVDLAAPMLAKARERGTYDELVEADLVDYFASGPAPFDLIVAADTLNYFGKLDALLGAIGDALVPGGLLVFSIEHTTDTPASGYRLCSHGRFEHTCAYIETALLEGHFVSLRSEQVQLRIESGQPVVGQIFSALIR